MSVQLDRLLKQVNQARGNRMETDISPRDNYWGLLNQYRAELHNSGGVHIPVEANLGVDVDSAVAVAVKAAANKHGEELLRTAKEQGELEAARIITEGEVKAAENMVEKEKNPEETDGRSDSELGLEAKQKKLDTIREKIDAINEAHNNAKENPPVIEEIIQTEEDKIKQPVPAIAVNTGVSITQTRDHKAGESEERRKDIEVLEGHGTALTTTERNPALNAPVENNIPQGGAQEMKGIGKDINVTDDTPISGADQIAKLKADGIIS